MSLLDAAIAANRFGLGARPGELRAIAGDPRGWLKAQIAPETAPPAPLAALPSTEAATGAFNRWLASIGLTPASASGGTFGTPLVLRSLKSVPLTLWTTAVG